MTTTLQNAVAEFIRTEHQHRKYGHPTIVEGCTECNHELAQFWGSDCEIFTGMKVFEEDIKLNGYDEEDMANYSVWEYAADCCGPNGGCDFIKRVDPKLSEPGDWLLVPDDESGEHYSEVEITKAGEFGNESLPVYMLTTRIPWELVRY